MQIYNARRKTQNIDSEDSLSRRSASTQHQPTPSKKSFLRRHAVLLTVISVSIASTGFLIIYLLNLETRAINARFIQDQRDTTAFYAQMQAIKKRKIEEAKQKEIEAKQAQEAEQKKAEELAKQQQAPSTSAQTTTPQRSCGVTNPSSITVVINKKHCFSPLDWAPSDLDQIDGFVMRAEMAEHMRMMVAAAAVSGYGFSFSSAYRSHANQQVTYNNWVAVNGSIQAADTVSARPGHSEHQTGLAADLKVSSCALECFGTTPQYAWLREHSAEYGFIQRYPSGLTSITGYEPEPWHWRYVGVDVAKDMKAKGIETLESYYSISGGMYAE